MFDASSMDINQVFDHISKYLVFNTSKGIECYFPVIIKYEWDGHSNAYWAFYGREIKYGFSCKKVLFAVCDSTYDGAVRKFLRLYLDYEAEGWISGRSWFGPKPHLLDLDNDSSDHSLIE